MNNIYDDDTYSEGKDEEDDIYPKISENDTNSIVSNGNNYMHKDSPPQEFSAVGVILLSKSK